MRVWRKDDNSSWGHRWWIQDEEFNWWYSKEDVLGHVYGWAYYGRNQGPVVYNEGLYESSEIVFLVTQGNPIGATLPESLLGPRKDTH